jgi:NAD-dependent dihydropyrimidine dehydrogenase PreA subunit
MSEDTFMGVPRKSIDWKPTIDYAKCNYCMECFDFCPHKVFKKQEGNSVQLIVENPLNCVVFCRACSKTCGLDALSFPDKVAVTKKIKQTREEMSASE